MGTETEEFLAHYGILGMKWGVRNDRSPGVSRSINKTASKDAKEFARAKLYYGDGAGTRRKLINAKVAERSKNSSNYKTAFEANLARQDMSKHSDKAVTERNRTDRRGRNKQRVSATARRIAGEPGTQAAFVALSFAGARYLTSPRGQAQMRRGLKTLKDKQNEILISRGAAKLLRDQGLEFF